MIKILFITLASQALAKGSESFGISNRRSLIESPGGGYMDSVVEMIQRRQSSTAAGLNFNSMSGQNATVWNAMTEEACMVSLKTMKNEVANPSGLAVCYNLPFLDQSSGVFEADLRVFMVAPPSGPFNNIPTDKIQVGLNYNGATVSPINMSSVKTRRDAGSVPISLSKNLKKLATRREMTPTLVQMYGFVGQINKSILPSDAETLQKVLAPNVTLSAVDSTGATVTTSLTAEELKFLTGVFARKQTTQTKPLLAPPIQTLVVAPDAPFVVPGLSILIFPIGLIITGLWTILIIGTIGYGTFGRIQWRERFRESKLRESRGSLKRI